MAKEYPIGAKMYLPVWVTAMESDVKVKPDGTEVKTDARFAYTYAYGEARREGYVRYGEPGRLLTAEEVAGDIDLVAKATLDEYTEKAEKRIRSLEQQLADANELLSDAQAQVKELTEADCMRVQEFKPIIKERDKLKEEVATRTENVKNLTEENDRLKGELEQEKKRTQVWKDSAEEHRQTAEELEADVKRYEQDIAEKEVAIQKLTRDNDSLKADIIELKAELEQEKKRTQVWKDASEDHRKTAEDLQVELNRYGMEISDYEMKLQGLGQENSSLKADILELKAQIDVFHSDSKEIEALKKRVNMLEKLKEVHVKTMRRLTRQIKEKNFMISALVKKGIELEEGGESNG